MDILRPVPTSPRQLQDEIIETDAAGVPRISERLFLLDCALPASELTKYYPSVWAYLESGRQAAVADGYLCRSRSPWYAQERRPRAPYLVSSTALRPTRSSVMAAPTAAGCTRSNRQNY